MSLEGKDEILVLAKVLHFFGYVWLPGLCVILDLSSSLFNLSKSFGLQYVVLSYMPSVKYIKPEEKRNYFHLESGREFRG